MESRWKKKSEEHSVFDKINVREVYIYNFKWKKKKRKQQFWFVKYKLYQGNKKVTIIKDCIKKSGNSSKGLCIASQ